MIASSTRVLGDPTAATEYIDPPPRLVGRARTSSPGALADRPRARARARPRGKKKARRVDPQRGRAAGRRLSAQRRALRPPPLTRRESRGGEVARAEERGARGGRGAVRSLARSRLGVALASSRQPSLSCARRRATPSTPPLALARAPSPRLSAHLAAAARATTSPGSARPCGRSSRSTRDVARRITYGGCRQREHRACGVPHQPPPLRAWRIAQATSVETKRDEVNEEKGKENGEEGEKTNRRKEETPRNKKIREEAKKRRRSR